MLAKDIMTKSVLTVTPSTSIKDAAKLLVDIEISGLIVVDENTNDVLGVVSEKDLIVAYDFLKSVTAPINDYINREVISIKEDTTVEEISKTLVQQNVKRVPVLNGNHLVGVVSRRDVLRSILKGS